MTDLHHESNRLELYKAGKLEERRTPRPPHVPQVAEIKTEQTGSFKLRPELVVIVLMVVALLILTLFAM